MWRRVVSSSLTNLRNLVPSPSPSPIRCSAFSLSRRSLTTSSPEAKPSSSSATPFPPHAATLSGGVPKTRVEDVMPIATGHEREEIEFELQGRYLLEMDSPSGPFGTKETPAIVRSVYDKRIVGCSGGERDDEHDVVWFWLEKGKPHECPVCSQYFMLEVVGPGGPPDGHGDHDHH